MSLARLTLRALLLFVVNNMSLAKPLKAPLVTTDRKILREFKNIAAPRPKEFTQ